MRNPFKRRQPAPPQPVTYKDALPLRARPPLPPYEELRSPKRPGDRELLPVRGVYVHGRTTT
jgi:hypothetical protein